MRATVLAAAAAPVRAGDGRWQRGEPRGGLLLHRAGAYPIPTWVRVRVRLRRHLCVLAMGDGSPVSREEDYFYTAQVHTPYSHDNCPQPKE